jgi:hypothetical protein
VTRTLIPAPALRKKHKRNATDKDVFFHVQYFDEGECRVINAIRFREIIFVNRFYKNRVKNQRHPKDCMQT